MGWITEFGPRPAELAAGNAPRRSQSIAFYFGSNGMQVAAAVSPKCPVGVTARNLVIGHTREVESFVRFIRTFDFIVQTHEPAVQGKVPVQSAVCRLAKSGGL